MTPRPPQGQDAGAAASTTTPATSSSSSSCIRGPDLNASRSALDQKLYRQILLPNGLRCVLVQDTLAMNEVAGGRAEYSYDDDDDDDDDDETSEEEEDHHQEEDEHEDNDDDDEDYDDDDSGIRNAAAAILVGAGSAYDPDSCQGLAHFLEHLLFMGSEKYPIENDYDLFVSRHGGTDNAFTEWEYTCYNLEIPQEYLWPGLDRLAQFFVAPLLLESAVERELQAVESEFQLHKNSDHGRWQQLLCATARPGHPITKFAWGNIQSLRDIPKKLLGVDPLKELRTFYNQYYYAANMRLAVIGAYTLDEMEERICKMFAAVPALPREPSPNKWALPIDPAQVGTSWQSTYCSPLKEAGMPFEVSLQKVFRIVPVKDCHSLMLTWQIPPQMEHWKNKPCDFLAHLLGHEAEGSLFAYFRQLSWAEGCMAGVGEEGQDQASSHSLFSLSFQLSKHGLQEWRSCVEMIYEYIGMLRHYAKEGWPDWIYQELKKTHEQEYHYRSEESPEELVDAIVEEMAPHRNMPPEHILDGSALLFEFDPAAIQHLLENYFTSENCRVDLMSSSYGQSADFEEEDTSAAAATVVTSAVTTIPTLIVAESVSRFDVATAGSPQIEPMFGTRFWCHALETEWLNHLSQLAQPKLPGGILSLPSPNPFVPVNLDLKPLPENDSRHVLVNSSLKLCIVVGKTKQWFPATVLRYDRRKNAILVSYEDEDEQWHVLDDPAEALIPEKLTRNFEGTMDKKAVRYRVIALSLAGRRARLLFGDESDFDVLEGKRFPTIPPAAAPDRLPRSICDTNALRMWWLQDRHFHRPIAELRLEIICAKANASPLHRGCAELMKSLCLDALIETTYLAEMCTLYSTITEVEAGFVIRIHGFDDKLIVLLRSTLQVFLSFRGCNSELPSSTSTERFLACLELLRRRYNNSGMSTSDLATKVRFQAMRPTYWSANERSKAIENLDIPRFVQIASEVMDEFAIECLYHGNVDRARAIQAKDLILSLINNTADLPRKKYPSHSVLRFPVSSKPLVVTVPSKNPTEPNTTVQVYVQVGKDNLKERVLIDVLTHMMDEPFYDQIRTKDQFGYEVACDVKWSWGIMGICFRVVTNVKSAAQVVERVDRFLTDFYKTDLQNKNNFAEQLIAVAQNKLDMFNSLSEESDSYWDEIHNGCFEWQAWRDEAVCLRSLTLVDVQKAFEAWLLPGKQRRILVVQAIGHGPGAVGEGRPVVVHEQVSDYVDNCVNNCRAACKKQFWGKVNPRCF